MQLCWEQTLTCKVNDVHYTDNKLARLKIQLKYKTVSETQGNQHQRALCLYQWLAKIVHSSKNCHFWGTNSVLQKKNEENFHLVLSTHLFKEAYATSQDNEEIYKYFGCSNLCQTNLSSSPLVSLNNHELQYHPIVEKITVTLFGRLSDWALLMKIRERAFRLVKGQEKTYKLLMHHCTLPGASTGMP